MGRRSKELWNRREAIEAGHFESWLARGRASFHMENLVFLQKVVDRCFRISGLYARGERNALDMKVRRMRFGFDDLPSAFDGFRILHLSDLHIDAIAGLADSVCDAIKDLEYDLCLLTGDYRFEIYGPYLAAHDRLGQVIQAVRAPHGVLGVLGNHDFAEVVPILEDLGVKMLVNDSHEIRVDNESVWCVGVDDPHYYRCDDLPGALEGVPDRAFKILAVHTPELHRQAARAGFRLYLCGHTHGGQVRLPLLGPVVTNSRCSRRLTSGAWKRDGMQGYTSSGVGSSMVPVRFHCPPEVALIEMRCTRPVPVTPPPRKPARLEVAPAACGTA